MISKVIESSPLTCLRVLSSSLFPFVSFPLTCRSLRLLCCLSQSLAHARPACTTTLQHPQIHHVLYGASTPLFYLQMNHGAPFTLFPAGWSRHPPRHLHTHHHTFCGLVNTSRTTFGTDGSMAPNAVSLAFLGMLLTGGG